LLVVLKSRPLRFTKSGVLRHAKIEIRQDRINQEEEETDNPRTLMLGFF
jgi:hypothetical protein